MTFLESLTSIEAIQARPGMYVDRTNPERLVADLIQDIHTMWPDSRTSIDMYPEDGLHSIRIQGKVDLKLLERCLSELYVPHPVSFAVLNALSTRLVLLSKNIDTTDRWEASFYKDGHLKAKSSLPWTPRAKQECVIVGFRLNPTYFDREFQPWLVENTTL